MVLTFHIRCRILTLERFIVSIFHFLRANSNFKTKNQYYSQSKDTTSLKYLVACNVSHIQKVIFIIILRRKYIILTCKYCYLQYFPIHFLNSHISALFFCGSCITLSPKVELFTFDVYLYFHES